MPLFRIVEQRTNSAGRLDLVVTHACGHHRPHLRVGADDEVDHHRAVVDVSTESLTIEATGTPEKLEALLRVLEPYGIRELVQSGVVSLSRGPRGIGTVK